MKYIAYCLLLVVLPVSIMAQNDGEKITVFQKGNRGSNDFFTGVVWVNVISVADTTFNTQIGNVTFEAGARTHWHTHGGGQILLVTDGIGYYQEKGEKRKVIRKGDVVKCMPGVEHWHGASIDTAMTHIAINTNTQKKIVTWLKPVTEAQYKNSE